MLTTLAAPGGRIIQSSAVQDTCARLFRKLHRACGYAHADEALVGPPERRSLPVGFDKNAIVQKLVEIAHTDEAGIVHEQTAIAARSMTE